MTNLEEPDTRKIPYLEWLWLRHSDPQDHFYPLAHLILDGGPPPTSPWKNKSSLNPIFVLRDVEALYATRRPGVTEHHVSLAREAVTTYQSTTETISTLVEQRKHHHLASNSILREAQTAPFKEANIPLLTDQPNNGPTLSLNPRCLFTDPSTGRNCQRRSLPGDTLCSRHGGQTFTPEELQQMYKAARHKLLAATEQAVDTTIELMDSPNDEVRRKAAEMVMDRTGLIPGQAIHVTTAPGDEEPKSAGDIILERLSRLAAPDTPSPTPQPSLTPSTHVDTFEPTTSHDEEVYEGEIVADSD